MNAIISLLHLLSVNPNTGDNSGTLVTILCVVGGLCVVALAALLLTSKSSKNKQNNAPAADETEEIEEVHDDQ